MIAQELEENIQFAFRDARKKQIEYVTVEHLVLALIDSREVGPLLKHLRTEHRSLRHDLERYLEQVPRQQRVEAEPQPTPGFQRVIRRAIEQVKAGGNRSVTGVNVLYSVHHEPESFAARALDRHGVSRAGVRDWMSKRARTRISRQPSPELDLDDEEELTVNLSAAAKEGRIEKPYHRKPIVDAVMRVMLRKYKSNPILVGEPGVGKTAIVHTLAHLALGSDMPKAMAGLAIHEVNVASLVAGTKYRGDFEAKLKKLLAKMAAQPGAVLFIDEIHTLIGAGSVSGSALDAANILKPALVDGRLRCIGSTTHAEFNRVFAKDSALSRRFQRIEVPEPSEQEAETILHQFTAKLAEHHGIAIADESVKAAVRLSGRYLSARCLPDKAIDLLDEAAATAALAGSTEVITPRHLQRTVAGMSGMSVRAINQDEKKVLRGLAGILKKGVFGQPEALDTLAAAVRRARLGLSEPDKPVGSFLFAGPTGVGKTETAKVLAGALNVELLRFDMSEHMEPHSVSRLIGAPPGYVGFEQQGLLTDRVTRHPHCVLLLDEIEKAHPDIFNIMLQVMDHGCLTDNSGAKADFRHAVIIMTTNAGADSWEKTPLGFAGGEAGGDETEAIGRLFTPEFRNRLNAVVRFAPLSRAASRKVIDNEIAKVAARLLADKGVNLSVSAKMRRWLLANGMSKTFGARPLKRLIDSKVVDALVDKMASGGVGPESQVEVDCGPEGEARIKVA